MKMSFNIGENGAVLAGELNFVSPISVTSICRDLLEIFTSISGRKEEKRAGVGLFWAWEMKCWEFDCTYPTRPLLGGCWASGKVGDTATVVGKLSLRGRKAGTYLCVLGL